jgi:hypothetical protein
LIAKGLKNSVKVRKTMAINVLSKRNILGPRRDTECFICSNSPLFAALTVVGGALSTNGNRFENCLTSVTSDAYNFLQVSNNNFKNCLFGVQIDGSSGFQITDHVFEHTANGPLLFNAGTSATSTSIDFNFAECNRYLSFNDNTRINVGISALVPRPAIKV